MSWALLPLTHTCQGVPAKLTGRFMSLYRLFSKTLWHRFKAHHPAVSAPCQSRFLGDSAQMFANRPSEIGCAAHCDGDFPRIIGLRQRDRTRPRF
jgi:hypothetical protein